MEFISVKNLNYSILQVTSIIYFLKCVLFRGYYDVAFECKV